MNEFQLDSECLLSKWGFNAGGMHESLLDLLDEQGIEYPDPRQWDAVLRRLVREYLLPMLDQRVEAVDIETSHNPIRVTSVDGVDVEHLWRVVETPSLLTPESVRVPIDDVLRIMREVMAS